jgi:hypothetical protein
VHFSFDNTFDSQKELEQLQFKRIQIDGGAVSGRRAEYHIELVVGEQQEQFHLSFLYNSSLYDERTIHLS